MKLHMVLVLMALSGCGQVDGASVPNEREVQASFSPPTTVPESSLTSLVGAPSTGDAVPALAAGAEVSAPTTTTPMTQPSTALPSASVSEEALTGRWTLAEEQSGALKEPAAGIEVNTSTGRNAMFLMAQECPIVGGEFHVKGDTIWFEETDEVLIAAVECDFVPLDVLSEIEDCMVKGCRYATDGQELRLSSETGSTYRLARR